VLLFVCMNVRLVGHSAKLLDMFLVAQLFFVWGSISLHLSYTPQHEGSEVILGKDIATLNTDTTLNYALLFALMIVHFTTRSVQKSDLAIYKKIK
jgi:hypothetical protein